MTGGVVFFIYFLRSVNNFVLTVFFPGFSRLASYH